MSANRRRLTQYALLLATTVLFRAAAIGADGDFYQRFTEAKSRTNGFLNEVSLVDTNNLGPNLTNAPVPFTKFSHEGELAGIKLGMTMSDVVAAWGKPSSLVTHCMFAPRFWYGTRYGNVSLSFNGDRLVLIVVCESSAKHLMFDNGLAGKMRMAESVKLLGPPDSHAPDRRESLYVGDIVYRAKAIRTDLRFYGHHLGSISVRLEQEAKSKWKQQVEQSGEPEPSLRP